MEYTSYWMKRIGVLIELCRIEIAETRLQNAHSLVLIELCRIEIIAAYRLGFDFVVLIELCRIEIKGSNTCLLFYKGLN